ncbi:MAG: carboxymuconolactone decarboxylase family protein [Betaproteobacteria bacterium]|nr:carboxymuconolactone decarboxylase family protein [Betaproteobacteria bacterium]
MNLPHAPCRMPPLAREDMNEAQKIAADELIAGPRKGVIGPFIPLLRSPELMARLQKVGEYLRYNSALPPRISEFATLMVSRMWTQQFEWFTHVPLALKAGVSQDTIDALRAGRRPTGMSAEERVAYDFITELHANHGVSDASYLECRECFSEQGVIDLIGVAGYFGLVSMVLNVAHTPPAAAGEGVEPLAPFPA